MPTFLQVAELPQRCFLREVLLWTAFQRLPRADYHLTDGFEIREGTVISEYCMAKADPLAKDYGVSLRISECRRAGIPPSPYVKESLEASLRFTPDFVDGLLQSYGVTREEIDLGGKQQDHEQARDAWMAQYDRVVEYFRSQIFLALRDGRLKATGRLFKRTENKDLVFTEEQAAAIEPSEIPPDFWTLRGIDFENSLAADSIRRYLFITCELEQVLALFPGERQPVEGIERIGDCFVLKDNHPKDFPSRGRPPFPWEPFHIEVAFMLRDGTLPKKKEAAIQHFQEWFQRHSGIKPSRSAIGQKLTPYYERRVNGQKI